MDAGRELASGWHREWRPPQRCPLRLPGRWKRARRRASPARSAHGRPGTFGLDLQASATARRRRCASPTWSRTGRRAAGALRHRRHRHRRARRQHRLHRRRVPRAGRRRPRREPEDLRGHERERRIRRAGRPDRPDAQGRLLRVPRRPRPLALPGLRAVPARDAETGEEIPGSRRARSGSASSTATQYPDFSGSPLRAVPREHALRLRMRFGRPGRGPTAWASRSAGRTSTTTSRRASG